MKGTRTTVSHIVVPKKPSSGFSPLIAVLVGVSVFAASVAVAWSMDQPVSVHVDGRTLRLRPGTSIAELQTDGVLASQAGRFLSVKGSVIATEGGDPARVTRNGRPVGPDQTLFEGDIVLSTPGVDTVEATTTVRQVVPFSTRTVGTGPVMAITRQGRDGAIERVVGVVSRDVLSETTVTVPLEMVVTRRHPTPKDKLIALTFDDGPWPGHTEKILDILKAAKIHATFFMLGVRVKAAPALAKRVVMEGNAIGDHTLGHRELTKEKPKEIRHQIVAGADIIENATGIRPIWFRPPYGAINAEVWKASRKLKMHVVLWDVDTRDWSKPGVNKIVATAEKHARKGSIILMHDGGVDRAQTIAALPKIIENLQKKGFIFVTVPELAAAR